MTRLPWETEREARGWQALFDAQDIMKGAMIQWGVLYAASVLFMLVALGVVILYTIAFHAKLSPAGLIALAGICITSGIPWWVMTREFARARKRLAGSFDLTRDINEHE